MSVATPRNTTQLLDKVADSAEDGSVKLGQIFDALGTRAYGPLLLAISLIAASPIGGIPGMTVVLASLLSLVAVQLLFGAEHPWAPDKIESMSFDKSRLTSAKDRFGPYLSRIDALLHRRLTLLTGDVAARFVAVEVLLIAATLYPLALVPFGATLPSLVIAVLALGLTADDGVVILVGHALFVAYAAGLVVVWPF
ncbi:Exopolysaccharide synthesis, ExoD [Botrimarina colliarenosi]|uniref:Exopolysaccharide synthesis, ExoD n=1 Tax=Botrimarina colliarenosi TaxID=2528001 RepID=A0A5C6ANG6_9BACT|nr:exopolysaccharide biosynthesis protein [Botrimarina colliarenosi]TWU00646.1 Exopolysaccharide synthesis, ExoD [Botrimarina colliarenosi]